MARNLRFFFKDSELEKAEAVEYPVLVAGSILPEKNAVAVFESDKEFAQWAQSTKYAPKISEAMRVISEFPNVAVDDEKEQKRLRTMTHETNRILEEFSNKTGVPTWSEEFFVKAVDEKVLHSSLIYRHIDLGGSFRPIVTGVPVPYFSWIGFNDVASSALVAGTLLLCARTRFRGPRLWLFGLAAVSWNLTDFDFNDRASSGAAF